MPETCTMQRCWQVEQPRIRQLVRRLWLHVYFIALRHSACNVLLHTCGIPGRKSRTEQQMAWSVEQTVKVS